jgi:tetratricopeptide (TPR) repeat protein
MSAAPTSTATPAERIAGKWQIPAFLAAGLALAVVALQVTSPDRKLSIDEHLVQLREFNTLGLFNTAIERCERLLAWDDLTETEHGAIGLQLARAEFGRWAAEGDPEPEAAKLVIGRYALAQGQGAELAAIDERNRARAFEHLHKYELAVKHYQRAVEKGGPPALADRRRIIELSEYPLRVETAQLGQLIDEFNELAVNDPQQLLWGLTLKIEHAASAGAEPVGDALLAGYREHFRGDALQAEYTFLRALALRNTGRYDEAERVLRDLLNRVTLADPVYPKAGWLLGRVVMYDGRAQRPDEALPIFADVIASQSDPTFVAASRVARAEALVSLLRYDEALVAFREAVTELGHLRVSRLINPDTVRAVLSVAAEQATGDERLDVAVEFETLALALVPAEDEETLSRHLVRLADAQMSRARELQARIAEPADADEDDDATAARAALGAEITELLTLAGENYVRLAWLNTLNERRSSLAMWTAASLFDEAGRHGRAIELLRRFVNERGDAEIIPRVLLRLGKALQAQGRYAEAVETYQRNISAHPRSPHAQAAHIPLAESLMALAPEREEEAETALRRIIDDATFFTPAAPEYRDALFLLADLFSRQERHEQAISTLDEILKRYPEDPRRIRALFLLAHAQFKSALAIKAELLEPEFAGESKRLDIERRNRLRRGAELFGEVIADLERRDPQTRAALEQVYLQDARLYEAACLYELDRYQAALERYERAAWLYKDSPAALGAYVQVINCDLALGRREEAQTALRRARYLVDSIPDERFAEAGQFESRDEWRRYFDWVEESLSRN